MIISDTSHEMSFFGKQSPECKTFLKAMILYSAEEITDLWG